jgi:hypothetical protein
MMARKRTNKHVPAKGRLKEMADQLWSLAVKSDWANKCAICGHRGDLNSHHLIPRQHVKTRYDLQNGICLCRRCHQFCPDKAPHQNPAGFMLWLEEFRPLLAEWYLGTMESGAYRNFEGTTNAAFYCGVIRTLREYVEEDDYRRICGAKFSAWLDSQE